MKIGPVEAVFEKDLEATFEQLLDPVSDVPRTEVADLLEDLARRIRQAELDRNGPAEEGRRPDFARPGVGPGRHGPHACGQPTGPVSSSSGTGW